MYANDLLSSFILSLTSYSSSNLVFIYIVLESLLLDICYYYILNGGNGYPPRNAGGA